MENRKGNILWTHREQIVADLDTKDVLDYLYEKLAITSSTYNEIREMRKRDTREKTTDHLIEIVIKTGNSAIDAFVDSLAKDYNWLYQKLNEHVAEPMLNESLKESLSKGNVPRLPAHYVTREALDKVVVRGLEGLSRHEILVLHGMPGSGKTSLAIHVLRTYADLITNHFKGSVFWLHLNNCKTVDDIIAQQNALYKKALNSTSNSLMNSTMSMSSSGSNFDMHSLSLSLSNYEATQQDLKDKLKAQFSERNQVLQNSLLVLDEVNEKRCVEAFDIGCKMLVITRDSDVVSGLQASIIYVENRLKKEETMKVLASYLEVDVSRLPEQARKIHKACKGSPFNVALIGAYLAEDRAMLLDDNTRWTDYLKKLVKKDLYWIFRPDKNPMKTIEVCIESLNPNTQQLFKKLAVLADDAGVSAQAISQLWNIKLDDTKNYLGAFSKKSLIIKSYNYNQKNYLYELHDLIANYLKTCFNEEETKKMHCDLLKNYGYGRSQPPLEIIDDGYIAFYLGYHILNTKNMNNSWTLFKLYLNLTFLGNKIRLTGPADVILDLEKYEAYIVENEPDRLFLHSIKTFLKTHGTDLYKYQHTDIVQSIIQHETEGILYAKALQIAENNCANNELYFDFVHERDVEEIKHSTIDVKEMISCVGFLGDYVLVGTQTGNVKLYHVPTNKLRKVRAVGGAGVRWVGACPALPRLVAALVADGGITLWHVSEDDLDDDQEEVIEEEIDEVDFGNFPITIKPKLGPFLNCRWSNHQRALITHTANMIMIYSFDGKVQKVFDKFDKDVEIQCCVPCNNDMCVIAAVVHNGVNTIEVIDQNKEKVMAFQETDKVLDITTVPDSNQIISLKSTEITVHEYEMNHPNGNSNHMCRCKVVLSAKDVKENLLFLAIAVNKTGSLLFVATDDSRVICIDLQTNSRAFDLENRRGNVTCMAVSEVVWDDFEPGSDVLLTGTGTEENCAKVWDLEAPYVAQKKRNSKVRLTKKFDVSFVNAQSPTTPTSVNSNQSVSNSPRRHRSFVNQTNRDQLKRQVTSSLSLDRHNLKLNLKGISNNNEQTLQPLLAVVDDKNNIQVLRGKKVLTEILTHTNDKITAIEISPCNHHIIYGLESGAVKKYVLRTKEDNIIMDMYSLVQYLNFVTPTLLIAGSRDCCLMVHRFTSEGVWKTNMLQQGNVNLGSQEIINDLQGIKKKPTIMDGVSSSGSENSLDSKHRVFKNENNIERTRKKYCGLVACFWVKDEGLITIKDNAAVELWDQDMKLVGVLKRSDLGESVTCAAFQKNILVICDGMKPGFLTFELKQGDKVELKLIQDYRLNSRITSCDLTSDGNVLAMGLENGDVVIWNVPARRQIRLLKHHTNSVKSCTFSPVPDRLYRPASQNTPSTPTTDVGDALTTPLVLITMASQIVWWNVTAMLNSNRNRSAYRSGRNSMTPVIVAKENKNKSMEDNVQASPDPVNSNCNNIFFGNTSNSQCAWNLLWKGKKCKEGSKKEEILSCIKLSGINAKKVCTDEYFSCFVTVDNSGHINIMNVMKPNKP